MPDTLPRLAPSQPQCPSRLTQTCNLLDASVQKYFGRGRAGFSPKNVVPPIGDLSQHLASGIEQVAGRYYASVAAASSPVTAPRGAGRPRAHDWSPSIESTRCPLSTR